MTPITSKKSNESSDQTAPSSAVVPAETNVPALTTKQMVGDINVIYREDVNARIRIGEYVFVNVFKEKMDDASSKNPRKNDSYADLAKSTDLELSDKELGLCLRVAVLERLFKKEAPELCGLKFSVKREIIKLQGEDKMLQLARDAYGESLTVEQTRTKVQAMIPHSDPYWGKKVLSGLNSPLGLVSNDKFKDIKDFCSTKTKLDKDLNRRERTKIRTTVQKKLEEIAGCATFLKGLEKTLSEIDAD